MKVNFRDPQCNPSADTEILVVEVPHRQPPQVYTETVGEFIQSSPVDITAFYPSEIEDCYGDFEDWPEGLQNIYDKEEEQIIYLHVDTRGRNDYWMVGTPDGHHWESNPTEFHLAASALEDDLSALMIFDFLVIQDEMYDRSQDKKSQLEWGEGEFDCPLPILGHQAIKVQKKVNKILRDQVYPWLEINPYPNS